MHMFQTHTAHMLLCLFPQHHTQFQCKYKILLDRQYIHLWYSIHCYKPRGNWWQSCPAQSMLRWMGGLRIGNTLPHFDNIHSNTRTCFRWQ